jgi:hypothetical protein
MTNDQLQHLKAVRDVLINAVELAEKNRYVTIEYRYRCTCGGWTLLNIEQCDYRCTIKPREVWVNEYSSGKWAAWPTREEADKRATSDRIRCTRFVEAPPEENQ